ncbi:SDR family oxidoreductase [Glaciecola sp. XM2]|uniref:SDR family NAD(P)-dependent oxidoreductase n=1 Tax=Glaciecola sp. XM2 TaxID=1914931 RepID=UPI001BDF0634|nr:SDR family oxidoreductase [Glaciecola sp. XM2]MBT1449427.1 SDR family oxidoreductase [Glaciecola sp. XM2]
MDKLLDFSDSVGLITGAGSGFGRALAIALNERGAKLVLTDIDSASLEQTRTLVKQAELVHTLTNDVSLESSAQESVDMAIKQFGKLDFAVNNAGIAHPQAAIHELTEQMYDQQFAVNVKGVGFGIKHQALAMLKQGSGHILNVSSLAGLGGAPKGGAYSAAKHAVIGLTRTAAVEYGRYNVRVNAICPFFSPTDIMKIDGLSTPEDKKKLGMGSPIKRISEIDEIVTVMVLMLSPRNTYMNGQSIAVDGGVTAW